ncbi:MAG: hypothetical protein WD009_01640 [Phycisphaeraceae bacterium]
MARYAIKQCLRPMIRWGDKPATRDGYSIVMGAPWMLRSLLEVNLRFIGQLDLTDLHEFHIVFDRTPRPGAEALMESARRAYPNIPLRFHFLEPHSGRIIERANSGAFYHAGCCLVGLKQCQSRYAILHDFDLYPLVPNHFDRVHQAMRDHVWRFCGTDYTHFDGLKDEDAIIGTWCLGVDVHWLRQTHRPIDCFHASRRHHGRLIHMDPFSSLQWRTPERGLTPPHDVRPYSHVSNLCSTALELEKGRSPNVAWRLHYLWYLKNLDAPEDAFLAMARRMRQADAPTLRVDPYEADFAGTHASCADALRKQLTAMDEALFGELRRGVLAFANAFEDFLLHFGDAAPIEREGEVVWSPQLVRAQRRTRTDEFQRQAQPTSS